MYRLLIVDDEPMIVNGMFYYFQSMQHLELDVFRAYDAFQALKLIDKYRMDIVLSDIQMPGMTGLEMQREILSRWPRCKIVFLTGYNEFAYIQSAFRSGAVDYVLKTEGREKILEIVERAIKDIENELMNDNHMNQAKRKMQMAAPVLWREYLLERLSEPRSSKSRFGQFQELGLPLDPDAPVYIVIGKIDRREETYDFADQSLLLFAVQNIAEEYLGHACDSVSFTVESNKIVWFIQRKYGCSDTPESAANRVQGLLESAQASSKQLLKLTISLVMSEDFCDWDQIGGKFGKLNSILSYGLGSGTEMLLTEQSYAKQTPRIDYSAETWHFRSRLKQIDKLESDLDGGNEERFFDSFSEMTDALRAGATDNASIGLEIFTTIGLFFLSFLNRRGLIEKVSSTIEVDKLVKFDKHRTWDEIVSYFKSVADCIFKCVRNEQNNATTSMILSIQRYVDEHIQEVTLSTLSEYVCLNPSYLSRFYKQTTGFSLSDYIKEVKIAKAKKLLQDPHIKVQEISTALGFESHPYFTQLFKRETGYTPQHYRDTVHLN